MDIETKNSEIKISETTAGCGSEVLAETDVIIPEDYPDIMRILQIDATAHIREKEVGNDRVILRGEANINIIYVPDPKMSDMPAKSITATAGFTDVCEAHGISADMKLHSCADVSDIEYNLVNSRKINIKSTVSTEIKAMRQGETEFISDASSDMDLKTLKIPVSTFCQEADEDFIITVADKLEFPSGKPAAADILKVSANVFGSEVKLISGKAVVKGNVRVSTLYIGKKDPAIEYMEHEIPFTEILDLPGINENMDADIDYSVQSVYYEADYDESGARMMGVEITVCANINVISRTETEILSDCYSPSCEITLAKRVCNIDSIKSLLSPDITVRGTALPSGNTPPLSAVYSIDAQPIIKRVTGNESGVLIEGVLKLSVLCLTQDPEMPLLSFKDFIDFSQTVNAENAENSAIECSAHLSAVSYTLSDTASVNVRANISASVKIIHTQKINVIDEIKISESEPPKRSPIVIYFVSDGDTLWSIAKKYRTTTERITAVNSISSQDNLKSGMKLIIP